jgi:hypothetical protein
MNRSGILVALLSLTAVVSASAGFKLKKDIYRVKELGAAKAEAQANKKAITFLYTDADTTCGVTAQASLDVIDNLDSKTVIIYVNSNNEYGFLPKSVQDALSTLEAGTCIPITVVMDADIKRLIVIVPYASDAERKRRLTKAKIEIAKALKAQEAVQGIGTNKSLAATTQSAKPDLRTWTSVSGKTLHAQFVKVEVDMALLKKPDGVSVTIRVADLCQNDQLLIRQLTPGQPQK